MKKILLSILSLCTLCATASAQVAQNVASQYHGELYISLEEPINEETEAMYCQTIDLTAKGDNAIDFALHNFNFSEMQLGDITIPEIGVAAQGTKICFGEKEPVSLVLAGGLIEATAQINAATSYVSADSIVVNLDIMWTNTGEDAVPIYVRFTGTKCRPLDATLINGLIDSYDMAVYIGEEQQPNGFMTIAKSETGDGVDWTWSDFTYNDVNYGDLKFEDLHFITRRWLYQNKWIDINMVSEYKNITLTKEGKNLAIDFYGDWCEAFYYGQENCDIISFYLKVTDNNWDTSSLFEISAWKQGQAILSVEKVETTAPANNKVYSLDGRYVGNSLNGKLSRGIYIMNGKKVFKK